MDSSTEEECSIIEKWFGGPEEVQKKTGSRAYERFTFAQLLKRLRGERDLLQSFHRLSLVSNLLPSVLLGEYAPIDWSDACGTNMFDIKLKTWNLRAIALLREYVRQAPSKTYIADSFLGETKATTSVLGEINDYFQQRYGFSPHCKICAFTGDNPSSVAALGLSLAGEIGISLGTSDTLMMVVDEPPENPECNVFVSPTHIHGNAYVVLFCFKNGGLVRNSLATELQSTHHHDDKWTSFDQALKTSTNELKSIEYLSMFNILPEITPRIKYTGESVYRIVENGNICAQNDVSIQHRAVAAVVSKFLSMRLRCRECGWDDPQKLVITGGGSQSRSVIQLASNLFRCHAEYYGFPDAAALGGALRAATLTGTNIEAVDVVFEQTNRFTPLSSDSNDVDALERAYFTLESKFKE